MSAYQFVGRDDAAGPDAADWLGLAATPTFALVALATAAYGGSPADILCSAAHMPFAFSGMALMYALMSAVHSTPWVRLIDSHRSRWRLLIPESRTPRLFDRRRRQ